jgi:hypothetical protein
MRFLGLGLAIALVASAAAHAQATLPPDILAVPANAPPPKAVPLGPYAVTVEADPTLPTHTIYRPTDLAPFAGGKLPVVAWGNGACANVGLMFKNFLTEIASHGYLVIAIGPIDAPLPDFRPPAGGGGRVIPPPATHDGQLIDAIDWAIAQNAKAGSRYQGKIDAAEVAVMGQSCGGLQAIAVSGDPRIKTTVIWNSGAFNSVQPGMPVLSAATKASLAKFHSPVAYFIGGPTDVSFPNAEDDFKRITGVPVFKGDLNVGHGGTYSQPNGGWFGEVGAAWLDWRLKGDKTAGAMFDGPRCGLCVDPAWTIEKKGMD